MRIHLITALSLIFISGCGAELNIPNGSGDGSTTTTFSVNNNWKIQPEAGQGAPKVLLSGKFGKDSGAYPDLALVTSTGVYMYKNRAPSANGWNNVPGRIDATAAGTHQFGLSFDIDLDNASRTDFLLYKPSQFETLTNDGDDTFTIEDTQPLVTNSQWMAAASFKNRTGANNKVHILSVADAGGTHAIFRSNDGELSAPQVVVGFGAAVRAFASDVNADGYADFIVIPSDGSPAVLLNDSDTSFSAPMGTFTGYNAARENLAATVGDFDKDGKTDLLLATSGGLEIYINKSTEDEISFQKNTDASFSVNPNNAIWVEYANLTEDENYDLIIARDGAAPLLLSGQGSMVFQDISAAAWGTQINSVFGSNTGEDVRQIYVLDIDQDRVNDLVMLNADGDITVFFNNADDSSDAD